MSARKANESRLSTSQGPNFSASNLPVQLSSFIGRKHETEKVKQLVMAHRLVTLTGAGGSGKTRLALKSAGEMTGEFKHGVWFVDLASLRDSALVSDKIASTLGVHKGPKEDVLNLLAGYLAKRQLLLILDNCEHLVAACAGIAELLLQKSSELHILTTSRELLGVSSEVTWVVPPLSLPKEESARKPASQRSVLNKVQASESVQLFIERAASKDPDFTLTGDNVGPVVEICRRLDGMPLAIELAAAQVRSLSPQEIAQRLDQRFHFLTGGSRNAPQRQRTLMAAIDWSYTLLTEKEQLMLQRLSIFSGGSTLEAAEMICAGGKLETVDVLETISHLVDKSLLTANRREHGETRYRLLETIREYALEKLKGSQDKSELLDKHLEYFIRFADQGDRKIKGPEQAVWFEKLEIEHDNLRAALHQAAESKNFEAGLSLAVSLTYFWYVRGHIREGAGWLEKFLNPIQDGSSSLVARGLVYLGIMYGMSNGEDDKRNRLHEKSLRLFRKLNDRPGIALVLNMLGVIALQNNELIKAEELLNESLALQKESGDPWDIAFTLQNFPELALLKGDLEKAREYTEEEIAWFERAGDQRGIARSLWDFANIARLEGDYSRAATIYTQVLSQLFQLGERVAVANLLENLSILAAKQRKYRRAALLLGGAEALREDLGIPYRRMEYEDYHQAVTAIRMNLSESNFDQALSKGRGMSLQEIVDYAIGGTNLPAVKSESTTEEEVWFQLTARERDVIRLLAQGHSNLEISQTLFLSEKTVRNYISTIYRKLGITNRGQAILLARKLVSTSEE